MHVQAPWVVYVPVQTTAPAVDAVTVTSQPYCVMVLAVTLGPLPTLVLVIVLKVRPVGVFERTGTKLRPTPTRWPALALGERMEQ